MARIDLAYTRHIQGDLEAAEAIYWAMIEEGEDALSAANNLCALLMAQRRSDDLRRLYLAISPRLPEDPAWARRLFDQPLAAGDYGAGWFWYEARRVAFPDKLVAPPFGFPEWRGEPVSNLLVWPEQGLGDMVQFARYLAPLHARGIKVTMVCPPELARLFAALPAAIVPKSSSMVLPAQDRWIMAGSLALASGPPYEPPPPARFIARPSRHGGIGVMSAGAAHHDNDANRSLPPDVAAELLALPNAVSLRPEDTGASDFQDTADLIAGLDLVITVDTAVAHLAGSLGKPTWVLLPAVRTDWRWQKVRTDSPLYPSVRLFRQTTPGDWAGVLAELRQALATAALPIRPRV
jgi:hypothetical protein